MDNIILLSGNSNVSLARDIYKYLKQTKTVKVSFNEHNIPTQFANTEIRSRIHDDLRGKDVFIIQTGCINKPKNLSINDILLETFILTDACRRSMAATVNIVMPNFPYARGDKKDEPRAPISAKLVANLLADSKINRLVAMDLHATQIQGFTDVPFDNIYSVKLVMDKLNQGIFKNISLEERQKKYIVVSPDAGAAKRTLKFAEVMKLNTIIMHKQRDYSKSSSIEKTIIIHEKNPGSPLNSTQTKETAIICDDIADTCGTLISAINQLVKYGIQDIICIITHGIFSRDALDKINNCKYISKFYVSDSIPQEENIKICPKLEVFTIADLMGDVIERVVTRKPISELFVY
jgi:ribose-phosphate pyrophosphokinase